MLEIPEVLLLPGIRESEGHVLTMKLMDTEGPIGKEDCSTVKGLDLLEGALN